MKRLYRDSLTAEVTVLALALLAAVMSIG